MYFASTEHIIFIRRLYINTINGKEKKYYHLFQIESSHKINTMQSQAIIILLSQPVDTEPEASILLLKMEIITYSRDI